eukprot:8403058-Heterocapsa_arctica.AAC.1
MDLGAADRNHLSKMGAVRIPREKLLAFLRTRGATQSIWPIMMSCKIGTQENSLGYIAYKDMGNAKYKE